jgi:hypothetical protein
MRQRELQCANLGKEPGAGKVKDKPLRLPPGYVLDFSDPDVLVLRRSDGSSVAAFSALGADPTEVCRAAEEDRRNLAARDEPLLNVLRKTRTAARLRLRRRRTPHRH